MKLLAHPCVTCAQLSPGEGPIEPTMRDARLVDNLSFHGECPNGHKSIFFLEHEKFEVLFDLGIMALLDGYYRESISSFAVAVERLNEFAIKVMMAAQGIPSSNPSFAKAWKQVSKQSERQFGAFLFVYIMHFGSDPPVLDQKHVELRNDAIHKGYIPTTKQVHAYASAVYSYVVQVLRQLIDASDHAVREVIRHDVERMYNEESAQGIRIGLLFPSVIGLSKKENVEGDYSLTDVGKRTWEECLAYRTEFRWLFP